MNINKNEIEVTEVNLTQEIILNYLNSGVTWFKKDDVGYGSIEAEYNANPAQIAVIRKHPAFKGVKTKVTIFNIIDDSKNETTRETKESTTNRTNGTTQQPAVSVVDREPILASNEAADSFANL